MPANQAQRELWNSANQAKTWPRRERFTKEVTAPLLDMLALQPGERVLDVGCGGGISSFAAAARVAPSGSVTGLDISMPLVALATQRAAEAKLANAAFVVGDAQVDEAPGAPFDAAMSQFGVMFFADPVAAFANIRRHLRPGGRVAFACWQSAAKNGWFPGAVLAPYQKPPPPPPASGIPPPSPFAFGDADYVAGILKSAGFGATRHEELAVEVIVPLDSIYDRDSVDALRLDPDRTERAWADLQAFAAKFRTADGQLRLNLAPQLFHATNPV